jgi:glutamate synthase (NADPH/NADH) small chain
MSTKLPSQRTETAFADWKPPYTPEQALAEANRCLFCADAPCTQACPTHIDIAQFIRKITTGNAYGSARTIFAANVLGMSCARVCPVEVLCVGDCVYHQLGQAPIQIGKLQRFATDLAYEKGWRFFEAGTPTGRSVALVGGGPASLACAHELRRRGHACTIYEKRDVLGGLNTTGIAPYKMRADRALTEVAWVLDIGGVEVLTGVEVPKDVTWRELEAQHDAVFVGIGLGPDRLFRVPGAELDGIHGSVEFIERMKLGEVSLEGVHDVLVLGGGNTAIDSVRELLALTRAHVALAYRGSAEVMSGYAHEWEVAKKDGARPYWHTLPVAFEPSAGGQRVARVRCQRTDENKHPIPGSEFAIEADLVLVAVGQSRLGELLAGLPGIQVERGQIVHDEHGATGRPGWYIGGDCRNGGKEVVWAAAEGKAAAEAIDSYLMNGKTAG